MKETTNSSDLALTKRVMRLSLPYKSIFIGCTLAAILLMPLSRIEIEENHFQDNTNGLHIQGKAHFNAKDNLFTSNRDCILCDNSGSDANRIESNRFEWGNDGINFVANNENLLFPQNCFFDMTDGIVIEQLPYGGVPSVSRHQTGQSLTSASDNCFVSIKGKDFRHNNLSDIFTYYVDLSLAAWECQYVKPDPLYTRANLPTSGKACKPAGSDDDDGFNDEFVCYFPKDPNEASRLMAQIYLRIQAIGTPSTIEEEIELGQLHRCYKQLSKHALKIFHKEGDWDAIKRVASKSEDIDVKLSVYGLLMSDAKYSEAENYLQNMKSSEEGFSVFQSLQLKNMERMKNPLNFEYEEEFIAQLYIAGMQRNRFAAWLRGMYSALTNESLYLPLNIIEGRSNGIEDTIPHDKITVQPNPIQDELVIERSQSQGSPLDLKVYNASGILIHTEVLHDDKQVIASESWQSGVYFLHFISAENGTKVIKVVK